jgi:hypothetical protein
MIVMVPGSSGVRKAYTHLYYLPAGLSKLRELPCEEAFTFSPETRNSRSAKLPASEV